MSTETTAIKTLGHASPRPRLGFLGLGWIGRMRLASVAEEGCAEIHALADPDPCALGEARRIAPEAASFASLESMLECDLDGVVIATPSALHAGQAIQALTRGVAVFCQKPLARTADEAREVVAAAQQSDRPLGVDYCYRHVRGVPEIRDAILRGDLGSVFAAELVFHNAYGPDKPWFRDLEQAGGGCLMDLGTHLLDLALWCLGDPPVLTLKSRLFANGELLSPPFVEVDDYAALDIDLAGGSHLTLTCSWNLHAGRDAIIEARFFGTRGSMALHNLNGSYYDFAVERMTGTATRTISGDPDAWGGRALLAWVGELAGGAGFDDRQGFIKVPRLLDRAYGRGEGAL
jgi:predicted dehydrogenase